MRKIESLIIKYIGYKDPENMQEIELEILGLETAIAVAKQRIAVLKQSTKLKEIMAASAEDTNAKSVQETHNP
jgi:hypothetical protein